MSRVNFNLDAGSKSFSALQVSEGVLWVYCMMHEADTLWKAPFKKFMLYFDLMQQQLRFEWPNRALIHICLHLER